jgi:glycosyltransferase involved in cell wall biosynthesis
VRRPVALLVGRQPRALLGTALRDAYALVAFRGNALQLAAAIVRHGAQIAHIEGSVSCVVAAKAAGARVLFQPPQQVARWGLRLADILVARTHPEREAYEAMLPEQSIAVVPHGIDPAPYLRYNRRPAHAAAPLRLLQFGPLAESIDALALSRSRVRAPRLTISGSGHEETRLRAKVRELGLEGEVTFAGAAWGEYKAKLLNDADVLLGAAEGASLLEAMAAGVVPIAASDAAVIAKDIVRLHCDRAELARLSRAGRQRVLSEHSLERLAEDFSAIYSLLIAWPASQAG